MKQKLFYEAFTKMYNYGGESLCNHQKEEFYRLLFKEVYAMVEDGMFDNDAIRKITSGNSHIYRRVAKKLVTPEGFEVFRAKIEKSYIPYIENKEQILAEVLEIFYADKSISDDIKSKIKNSLTDASDYQISRALAGVLICLDYSDYLIEKGKNQFFKIDFMRLSADEPPARYPQFITESPDSVVLDFIGREDELDELSTSVIEKQLNILVSAVGGLGKTELVKNFLRTVVNTETKTSGIEIIAWVPYNNNDIRLSIKQALHMQCDLEEVWLEMQNISAKYGKSLLLVVDNIETVENDEYLKKLSCLQCSIIVTSRLRALPGFSNVMDLQPLTMNKCRELFYKHYEFNERDNETVNDIIYLTAKLTIMIIFIAKAAHLEEMSLNELYGKLVAKGFKLSDEDVSCEHEKLQNDDTIIRQMCILFSLVKYNDTDKQLLTYASVIPNLEFSFPDAKKWFKVKKNSCLMRLYKMGMLEYHIKDRKHIYRMHSVIAAAIREQQKEILYDTTAPFIHKLSEDMELGDEWGKGYTKFELIPFSWSVADIFENHWGTEDDATFLLRLYYICFEASNYPLCKTLIEKVIEIDKTIGNTEMLIRDYKNYAELLLRIDNDADSIKMLDIARGYMEQLDPTGKMKREWAYLWHQYGNVYYHSGKPNKALDYYTDALELDLSIPNIPPRELSTDYSSIATIFQVHGDLPTAYEMMQKAISVEEIDDEDSESIMNYYYMATICTDFVANGYDEYCDEAQECYEKVIAFREKHLSKHSNDLADVYMEYSNFLYQISDNKNARKYCRKAYDIYFYLYGEDSYHILQCMSNEALILAAEGKEDDAVLLYREIIDRIKQISNIPLSDLCNDYQNFADLLEHSDEYEEAKEYYLKCIDLVKEAFSDDSPRLLQPYLGLANCCMGLNDYENAIDYLLQLKAFSDEDMLLKRIIYYKVGTCYVILGKYDTGIEHFKKAIQLCDENGETDLGYIYVDMSNTYHLMGKEDEALYYGNLARDFESKFDDKDLSEYVHTLNAFLPEKQNIF